jgi:hypothetical protein
MELFDALNSVNKVASAHVLHFNRNFWVYILIEPICIEEEFVCRVVNISDTLSSQKTSFFNKFSDEVAVIILMVI